MGRFGFCCLFIFLVLGIVGCGSRQDSGVHAPSPDAGYSIDAFTEPCGRAPLFMDFSLETTLAPRDVANGIEEYVLSGECLDHSTIWPEDPAYPGLTHKLSILTDNGQVSWLRYTLPNARVLPVTAGQFYTLRYRVYHLADGKSIGVRLVRDFDDDTYDSRLLFIGDTGQGARALAEDDPLLAPLQVTPAPLENCPLVNDASGCGEIRLHRLDFLNTEPVSSSSQAQLTQGSHATIDIGDSEYLVTNLASYEITPGCTERPQQKNAYLVIGPPEWVGCYRERVSSSGDDFGYGATCEKIDFCASQEVALQAEIVAPLMQCDENKTECPDGLYCHLDIPSTFVGNEIFYEVCSVTLLLAQDESLYCRAK